MNEQAFFHSLLIGWFLLAVVVFIALLLVAAPYGRHFRSGWGPTINNKLGEVTIWLGWAVATWSLPGWAFATWTVANLAPRAQANHAWYREHFPNYPPERRALLPGLW